MSAKSSEHTPEQELGPLNNTSRRGKNASIQTLRGLAILLMVAGHVIGSTESRGMNVDADSWWRFYYLAFADIRMPLFTMLSGYVYALRPSRSVPELQGLVRGKSRRLLIPLVTVGSIFFVTQLLVPGTNSKPEPSDFWKIFVYGIEHLWFVQAVFIIFLLVGGLDVFGALSTRKRMATAVAAASLLYVLVTVRDQWDFFSVSGAIRLLPFFLIGIWLSRFPNEIKGRRMGLAVFSAIGLFFLLRTLTILFDLTLSDQADRLLSVFLGISAVVGLFLASQKITFKFLSWLGGYSFGIYLLHTFGSAGIRIVLEKLNVSDELLVFVICMVSAVTLPILFEVVFRKSKLVSWGILGQRPSLVTIRQ